MGSSATKPGPIRPIYRIRLHITVKKVAQRWKRYGLTETTKKEILDSSSPFINVQHGHDNLWGYIVKNIQVKNIDHKGIANICFGGYFLVADAAYMKQVMNQMTTHLSSLTELNIHLPLGANEQNFAELMITEISRHLTRLRKLRWSFSRVETDERTFRIVGLEIAKNLVNLEELAVIYIGGKEHSINNFLRPINKYMNKLTCLKWRFDEKDKNKTLEAFANNLGRGLAGLRHLEITMSTCWNIDNDGFELLFSKISKHLVKLQSLTILAKRCNFDKKRILELFRTKLPHLSPKGIEID